MKPLRKVFSIVPDCHTRSGHYRGLWQRHFYDGLRASVETLVVPGDVDFDWARQGTTFDLCVPSPERDRTDEKLWEQIQSAHRVHGVDAVISYCFGHDVSGELVKQTIRLGVPWVNFFCDSTHVFERVEPLARVVSLNWFPEHAAITSYRALGVPFACLPYALNPTALPDCTLRTAAYPVIFIGLPTANRISQLGWLRLCGCRVEVRGHGWIGAADNPFQSNVSRWERFKKALPKPDLPEKIFRRFVWPLVRKQALGPLGDDEFQEFLRQSEIVLGLNQGRDARGCLQSYLKFRDVEFPGYGCCYLTEHNDDVAGAFEVGKEVLTYRSIREAAAMIRKTHRDLTRLKQIGVAGRRRVLSEHTWATRLDQLAELL